jgi:hypothetical protein
MEIWSYDFVGPTLAFKQNGGKYLVFESSLEKKKLQFKNVAIGVF